jgi:peroxiredoxin
MGASHRQHLLGSRVGVLVGGVSRSKRLARVVVVCARGSQRVSELAAAEDIRPTHRNEISRRRETIPA